MSNKDLAWQIRDLTDRLERERRKAYAFKMALMIQAYKSERLASKHTQDFCKKVLEEFNK